MAARNDWELQVRIVVRTPPPGVAFAVQRGRDELLAPSGRAADALTFEFGIRVGTPAVPGGVRLLGDYAQGPPSGRFVYVNSGQRAGQLGSPWTRRAKVPLAGISAAMIEAVACESGACVETTFDGTGRDGGPTCASVKGITWRVVAR